MTFKPNDPHTIECSRKGNAVAGKVRFREGEPLASIAGRKGRWLSPWNDRSLAEHRRHKRLELIKRADARTDTRTRAGA